MLSSVRILGLAIRDLVRLFVPLLGYDILFRVTSSVLLVPATAAILLLMVRATGREAVGNLEIAVFLLSPLGVATLLVTGILSLSLLYLEHAGLILIGQAALGGRRISALSAYLATARGLPRLLELGVRQLVVLAILAVPFLVPVGIAYGMLWSGYDLYYLTNERPPQFWIGAGVAALAAAAYALVAIPLALRWLVALPALLVDRARPAQAMRLSAERTSGTRGRNFAVLALVVLGVTGAEAIALAAYTYLSDMLLDRVTESETLIAWLGLLMATNFVIVSAFSFVATALSALAVVRIDQEWREQHPMPVVAGAPSYEWPPRRTGKTIRLAVLGTLGTLMVVVSLTCYALIESLELRPAIAITAHRGDSARAPENTLASIEQAIEAGADYAEIDVQLSADGVVFVFHDEDLRRIAGDPRRVTALTFDELRQIDAGAWFEERFAGERIPSLAELIDAVGDRIRLNIELKFPTDGSAPAPLAREVVRVVREKNFADRCVLSSLSFGGLAEIRRLAPELTIGSIIFQAVGNPARLDVDFLSVREAIANEALIAAAHRAGKAVHVWSVHNPDLLFGLISRGVDNVITSTPAAMVERRAELAQLSNLDRLLLWYREGLSWWG